MKYILKSILLLVVISSCDKNMAEEPKKDCDWKNTFSRFERIISDQDTSSLLYKQDIIRIRYDRIFSHLEGKDCSRRLQNTKCTSGDFYIYNLINDTVLIWMSYTRRSDDLSKADRFTVLPLDSVVLINDPDICDKNTPGFRFFY